MVDLFYISLPEVFLTKVVLQILRRNMSVFNVINNFIVAGRILENKFGLSSKFTRSYVWSFHEERLQVDESDKQRMKSNTLSKQGSRRCYHRRFGFSLTIFPPFF